MHMDLAQTTLKPIRRSELSITHRWLLQQSLLAPTSNHSMSPKAASAFWHLHPRHTVGPSYSVQLKGSVQYRTALRSALDSTESMRTSQETLIQSWPVQP